MLEEPILCDVIVLQTVLNEVKHKSSVVYKKLLQVLKEPTRRFYTFVNEHHKDTYAERTIGETANDRNDRAIRLATAWYDEHFAEQQQQKGERIRAVLLTDDAANRAKAQAAGLLATSIGDYVRAMAEHPELQDKLAHTTFESADSKAKLFPPHLTPSLIHERIKSGVLLQGAFQASRENYLEGSVNVEGIEKFVLVQGRDGLNRAVDGDVVAVELLPEDQWRGPSEIVLQDEGIDDGVDVAQQDAEIQRDSAGAATVDPEQRQPTGRIVGIIRRKWRQYCGILQPSVVKGSHWHLFVPAERKVPKVRVNTRQAEQLKMQRIIVAIDTWPINSR